MATVIAFRLAFIILSIHCELVTSSLYPASRKDGTTPGDKSTFTQQVLTEDIVIILSTLSGRSATHLEFLYDEHHEEVVNEVVFFTKKTAGVLVYYYDNSEIPLRRILVPPEVPTLLLVLCSTKNILQIFRKIKKERMESHFVDWLIMVGNENARDEVSVGLEGLIYEGTHVILMARNSTGKFDVSSSRVDVYGDIGFYDRGQIDLEDSKEMSRIFDLVDRDDRHLYTNMNGRFFKVAVVSNYGLCTLGHEYPDGSVEALSGTDISMVKALSQALNFTFQTVYPPDKTYGNPLPNGTVTGMVGMAARRDVGFSTCSIALSNLRETVVDFAYPYVRGSLGIFSRAPKQKSRALAVLSPFTLEVWVCLIISTLAIGPIVTFQSKISEKFRHSGVSTKWDFQWHSLNMYRSFVVQGNRIQAKTWPQRLILYTWFLFCLIVSALYSGMLTSVLAVPEYEIPVDSLTDLPRAVSEGFTLGVLKDSANELIFKEATGGIYKSTWRLFNHEDRSESFVDGNASGMDRVAQRKYIYIGFKLACEILATMLGRRKIHVARETLFDHSLGVAVPPGVPYQKTFSDKLMQMVEGGFIGKWKDDEITRISRGISSGEESSQNYAISLTHLQAAFFVVVLGYLVSALALVGENIVWYFLLYRQHS